MENMEETTFDLNNEQFDCELNQEGDYVECVLDNIMESIRM